jgi:hypothetical protein
MRINRATPLKRSFAQDAADPDSYFRWTVQIDVHETWVADGFELTEERLHDMITKDLNFAYGHEVSGRILKAPPKKQIRLAQGYVDKETD